MLWRNPVGDRKSRDDGLNAIRLDACVYAGVKEFSEN